MLDLKLRNPTRGQMVQYCISPVVHLSPSTRGHLSLLILSTQEKSNAEANCKTLNAFEI